MKNLHIQILGNGLPSHLSLVKFYKNNKINWDYVESNFELPMSSTLDLIPFLKEGINFDWSDLNLINGSLKTGVQKRNYNNKVFNSNFHAPYVALHFDTLSMCKYLYDQCGYTKTKKSDIIINTSKPETFETYKLLNHVPTNCGVGYKIKEKHNITHTTIEAVEHGWLQTIPTKDYIYVYYIFNSDLNTPQEIANSLPLRNYNYQVINFSSYYYQDPFLDQELKLGLNSFFIEPFDATSISGNIRLLDLYTEIKNNFIKKDEGLYLYYDYIKEAMEVLMLHYVSDVPYKSKFWQEAKDKAVDYLTNTGVKKRDVSNFYTKEGYNKLYKNLNVFNYIQ
jgi:hypothetical protein